MARRTYPRKKSQVTIPPSATPLARSGFEAGKRLSHFLSSVAPGLAVLISIIGLVFAYQANQLSKLNINEQFQTKLNPICNVNYEGAAKSLDLNLRVSQADNTYDVSVPVRCEVPNLAGKTVTVNGVSGNFIQNRSKANPRVLTVTADIKNLTYTDSSSPIDVSAFGDTNVTISSGEQKNIAMDATFPIVSTYGQYMDCDGILFNDQTVTCHMKSEESEVWEKLLGKTYGTLNGVEDTYLQITFTTIDGVPFSTQVCLPGQVCL